MSAIAPYVVSGETPQSLKNLIIRFPFTIDAFDNIIHGKNVADNLYYDSAEMLTEDDPIVRIIVNELCTHKLCSRTSDEKLESHYSKMVLVKNSFTPEENRAYTASLLRQMSASIHVPSEDTRGVDFDVKNFYLRATLSPEDMATMVEGVSGTMTQARDKPDGKVRFVATFVVKQF
ncbi:MAG: hypothetical protein EOP04_02270 [Proteobacteria bacterium]|nr:MAG: hypothetical protein EOP04_02270 [Pseudomonadota bacterium]